MVQYCEGTIKSLKIQFLLEPEFTQANRLVKQFLDEVTILLDQFTEIKHTSHFDDIYMTNSMQLHEAVLELICPVLPVDYSERPVQAVLKQC